MVRHIDAIFTQGSFRPVEPVTLPEGTRVHLSVDDNTESYPLTNVSRIWSPRLVHPEDVADFVMEVGEGNDDKL